MFHRLDGAERNEAASQVRAKQAKEQGKGTGKRNSIGPAPFFLPGLYRDLLTYLTERIKEVLTGSSGAIVVRIYGSNLEELRATAEDVAAVMGQVDGVTNLKVEPQKLIPQIVVDFKPDAAAQFGLTPGDVRRATTTLIRGTQVGEISEDQKIFRVMVWGTESVRRDVDVLRELMIDTPSGGQVPLSAVVDVSIQPAANAISG